MTFAPDDLLAVRAYLLAVTGLSGDAVGIVGDPAHAATGGYHEGNDDLARVGRLTSDYSKRESPHDRSGSNAASAIDLGEWSGKRGALGVTFLRYNATLVNLCATGHPLTRNIREVIYTPDGSTVRRWDALGVRTTGDSSHLYHTHKSYFRDSEGGRTDALDRLIFDGVGAGTMGSVWDEIIGAGYTPGGAAYGQNMFRTAAGYTWFRVDEINGKVDKVLAGQAAEVARDAVSKAAIDGLVTMIQGAGGDVDLAALKASMVDAAHQAVGPLEELVSKQGAELEKLRHALADAERRAGEAAANAIEGNTAA